MAGVTAWAAHENPLQVLTMADDIAADGRAVRTDVSCMLRYGRRKVDDGIPINGMRREFIAVHMAERTGRSGPADAVQVCPMAIDIGAGGSEGIIHFHNPPVQGIGEGTPLVGVHGKLVAEVALSAGDLRNPSAKIGAMTGGAGFHMGLRLHLMPGRQPFCGVLTADGIQVGLRVLIPASGKQKEGKQQYNRQNYRRRENSLYL